MKNKKVLDCLCLLLILFSLIYTVWYISHGNIFENSGALSTIGLDYPVLFAVWGVTSQITIALNTKNLYSNIPKKFKFTNILIALSTIGILFTVIFKFDYDLKVNYYLHCAGAFSFTVFNFLNIILYFIINYKKSSVYRFSALFCFSAIITSLVLLIITKETALNESIPLFTAYIIFIINIIFHGRNICKNSKKEKTKIEPKKQTQKLFK